MTLMIVVTQQTITCTAQDFLSMDKSASTKNVVNTTSSNVRTCYQCGQQCSMYNFQLPYASITFTRAKSIDSWAKICMRLSQYVLSYHWGEPHIDRDNVPRARNFVFIYHLSICHGVRLSHPTFPKITRLEHTYSINNTQLTCSAEEQVNTHHHTIEDETELFLGARLSA